MSYWYPNSFLPSPVRLNDWKASYDPLIFSHYRSRPPEDWTHRQVPVAPKRKPDPNRCARWKAFHRGSWRELLRSLAQCATERHQVSKLAPCDHGFLNLELRHGLTSDSAGWTSYRSRIDLNQLARRSPRCVGLGVRGSAVPVLRFSLGTVE